MTKLRDIVSYVAVKPSKLVPFRELHGHFKGDLTGLKIALDRNLLELRYSCYALTAPGAEFLARATLTPVDQKDCYECQRTLPAEQFWKNASSGDGLFDYCITCGNRKKRKAMEARRQQARFRIEIAAGNLIAYAQQWDYAVAMLADAWRGIMACDEIARLAAQDLGTDNDSGRMHARVTFPRAAFTLNVALADVHFPQTVPLLREVGFPERLADYIGEAPHLDYIKGDSKVEESASDQAPTTECGEGPQEGRAEQSDQGIEADGARGARSRGRGKLPAAPGEETKPRRVSQTRRAMPA